MIPTFPDKPPSNRKCRINNQQWHALYFLGQSACGFLGLPATSPFEQAVTWHLGQEKSRLSSPSEVSQLGLFVQQQPSV